MFYRFSNQIKFLRLQCAWIEEDGIGFDAREDGRGMAAQMGGSYTEIRDAWLEADRLGFDTGWLHDHLLNQNDITLPEDEGWTVLTSLLTELPV